MEKKEKVVTNGLNLKNCSKNALTEQDLERIKNMKIYGFEDSLSVARTLMGGIHENLLLGDLVFAYRSTSAKNKTELYQIVVGRH